MAWIALIFIFLIGFLTLFLWFRHQETMELARQGLVRKPRTAADIKRRRGGLVTAFVGLAITLGMLPMVLSEGAEASPALIGGLVPLGVGLALIMASGSAEDEAEMMGRQLRDSRKITAGQEDDVWQSSFDDAEQVAARKSQPSQKDDPHAWLE